MYFKIKCIKNFFSLSKDNHKILFEYDKIYQAKFYDDSEKEIGIIDNYKMIWWFELHHKDNYKYYRQAEDYFDVKQFLKLKMFT